MLCQEGGCYSSPLKLTLSFACALLQSCGTSLLLQTTIADCTRCLIIISAISALKIPAALPHDGSGMTRAVNLSQCFDIIESRLSVIGAKLACTADCVADAAISPENAALYQRYAAMHSRLAAIEHQLRIQHPEGAYPRDGDAMCTFRDLCSGADPSALRIQHLQTLE